MPTAFVRTNACCRKRGRSESTARPYTTLSPHKQVEAAKLVAKKFKKPTAKQIAEAVDEVSGKKAKPQKPSICTGFEEKPRVQCYDPREEAEGVDESEVVVAEKVTANSDSDLISLAKLHQLVVQLYDDYNSGLDGKVASGLKMLKAETKKLAESEANQVKGKAAI